VISQDLVLATTTEADYEYLRNNAKNSYKTQLEQAGDPHRIYLPSEFQRVDSLSW
jgi:hypothetical protein